MEYFTEHWVEPIADEKKKKREETAKIKRVANLTGAVFIIMNFLPSVLSGIISNVAKLFGLAAPLGTLFSDPAFSMVLQTVFSVIIFTLPFIILPLGLGKGIGELASIKKPNGALFVPFILLGVGVSAFSNIINNNIISIFESIGINFTAPDIAYPQGVFGFILSFIAIAVIPALTEEFATRGMVMGAARDFGEDFALITSALFFSLMHGNMVQIPFAFIMGLIIGFAVIKTGSLITGFIIHFLNNTVAVIMNYVMMNVESVMLQTIISAAYFGICAVLFFIGLYLTRRGEGNVWQLNKGDSLLPLGNKVKLFVFSPTMIVAIGFILVDCISTINFG